MLSEEVDMGKVLKGLRGKEYAEKSGFDLLKLVERNVTKELYIL